ncbi:MAG: SDR family NAD(P)-dependent oxidoreductase [bacterium]|nr:SDR family NAD(P)-dependent oxidoreductase [bacterium]
MSVTKPKHVVITGASSGIGSELARLFVKDGHRVSLFARRGPLLEELKRELCDSHSSTSEGHSKESDRHSSESWNPVQEKPGDPRSGSGMTDGRSGMTEGVRVFTCAVDVGERDAMHEAVAAAVQALGPVDIAIANAGVAIPSPGTTFNATAYDESMRVNVMGAVHLFDAVLPGMMARKEPSLHGNNTATRPQLVSISSLAAYRGMPESGAYCASKAALSVLTESLRQDLAPHGIDCTLIHPGFIESAITARNNFKMPCFMSLENGAARIYKAILKHKRVYSFPFPMALAARLTRLLPAWLFDYVLKGKRGLKSPN